jgi:hypothetical protein
VIGGNVKGGENGFLVDSVDQAADRIVQLLRDRALRTKLGATTSTAIGAL